MDKDTDKSKFLLELEAKLRKTERKVWLLDLVGNVLAVLATVIGLVISFGNVEISKPQNLIIIATVIGFIFLLVIFAVILRKLKKGSEKVINIKDSLQGAFFQALDSSVINPRNLTGEKDARYLKSE